MNDKDYKDLSEYASLDGCEIGTYVNHLLELRRFSEPHGMTLDFSVALDKELADWLVTFRAETVIEETTEKQPDITYKELVWL
tara:strand:- start:8147 stop:8395 length:249 start_codon:yes stop_codon:yes gene_type:complete